MSRVSQASMFMVKVTLEVESVKEPMKNLQSACVRFPVKIKRKKLETIVHNRETDVLSIRKKIT